jgi:peptidyl-prolyl cis-trans isomerase C
MLHFRTAAAALAGAGLIAAASVFALIAEPAAGRAQSAAETPAGDVVVAKVDGETVHLSELMAAYGQLPAQAQQMGIEAVYPFLLDRVIDERLLGIAAAKAVPADDPELQEQMDQLRQRVTMQVYFNRELEEKVTEERIREGYDQFLKDNPPTEEVHARHILLETEDKAKEVLTEIQGGKDFAEAAKEHSTGPSGPNGGDLGYFGADAMVKPFADAAFAMQTGDVSSAPVQTEFGWHLIKLEDRRETAQPAFEEMREQISQELTQTVATEIIDALRGAATIEKFDIAGNPAPEEEPAQQ